MIFYKYLKYVATISVTILLLVVIFNRIVNPFHIFVGPNIDGFNKIKPEISNYLRMYKAARINQIKPVSIILGTSRGETAIDPLHPGWSNKGTYNLSLSSSNLYESYRYLQHAHFNHPLRQVVLSLDLMMFNVNGNPDELDFKEGRLAVDSKGKSWKGWILSDIVSTLASSDALEVSIKTILRQDVSSHGIEPIYLDNGMRDESTKNNEIKKFGGHHKAFLDSEKKYYEGSFYNDFSFSNLQRDNWQIYRQLLMFAHQNNIDLRIAISPYHARQLEIIAIKSLLDVFEDWKTKLVSINYEVATDNDKKIFPLWDFSTYNTYTTEKVPHVDSETDKMQWYWESSHYKKELGDLVLNVIFDYKKDSHNIDHNFGVVITKDNIKSHLGKISEERQQWRDMYPEDVQEIERLIVR
jgi:hypothetical protein